MQSRGFWEVKEFEGTKMQLLDGSKRNKSVRYLLPRELFGALIQGEGDRVQESVVPRMRWEHGTC